MLADHLMSHLQPWLVDDIHAILNEPEPAAVKGHRYIGIHVRRGDKLHTPQGKRIESEARSSAMPDVSPSVLECFSRAGRVVNCLVK